MYGITQNPDTKDYILVLQFGKYCLCCNKIYTNIGSKWCKPCQINNLRINFTNWTSGNEKIDEFIQKMQLKIKKPNDIIFEWIPYNQFNDINEIVKYDTGTAYSAIWKDGPLYWCGLYRRDSYNKVGLKCLYNSQNNINEFFNKVGACITN